MAIHTKVADTFDLCFAYQMGDKNCAILALKDAIAQGSITIFEFMNIARSGGWLGEDALETILADVEQSAA